MTTRIADISPRKAARVTGFAFIIMTISAIFTNFFVRQRLIVPGDAATTANNIMANELLFRSSIPSWIIVLTCDVVVVLTLYILLKPVNKSLALITAWFRLVYTAIHGSALINLIFILQLLSGADYLTVFETDHLHALMLLFLNGRPYGFLIGSAFFGFHLFLLGYLVYKSGYLPRIFGVWLISASLFYLIDSSANFLLPNYEAYAAIFLLVGFATGFSELFLGLWLLVKGVKVQQP